MRTILVCLLTLIGHHTALAAQATDTLWTIGTFDGPDELVFASIVDAEILPDGSILVLDDQLRELRRYDAEGRYLGTVGGGGQGPGEFLAPVGMASAPGGRTVVADRRNLRLSVYALEGESLGLVQAYATGGSLLWTDTLPDFVPIQVSVEGRGVHFTPDPERGMDLTVSAFGPGDGRSFMLQVGHRAPGSRRGEDYTFIRSWVYDAGSGTRSYLSDGIPLIRSATGGRAAAVGGLPFPTLSLVRWSPPGPPHQGKELP